MPFLAVAAGAPFHTCSKLPRHERPRTRGERRSGSERRRPDQDQSEALGGSLARRRPVPVFQQSRFITAYENPPYRHDHGVRCAKADILHGWQVKRATRTPVARAPSTRTTNASALSVSADHRGVTRCSVLTAPAATRCSLRRGRSTHDGRADGYRSKTSSASAQTSRVAKLGAAPSTALFVGGPSVPIVDVADIDPAKVPAVAA
jgi:hypothetical protein